MFYQALLVIPALTYFYNKRLARIFLAAIEIILLSLNLTNLVTLQLSQVIVVVASLILLMDPGSNPELLSIVTFISTIPLPQSLTLVSLALFLFVALAVKRCQKRFALYVLIVIPFTLILQYFGYSFAAVGLVLMLVGVPPFHKWLSDLYSNYQSTGVLVAVVALSYLNAYQASYAPLMPLFLFFGTLMMIVGIFQCMISRSFTDLYSTSHQIILGLLLVSAAVGELQALFFYLLLPSILSLTIIHFVHSHLAEETKKTGMLEFGGLSTGLRVEAASTLTTYLILFTLVSLSAEIFMQIGVNGNIVFILLGCATLFVAAASLAVFFRNYTLIYEGLSKSDVRSSNTEKFAVGALLGGNLVTGLIPATSFSIFSFIDGWQPPKFETFNALLLISLAAILLSIMIVVFAKPSKTKSWTTGYTSVDELHESRGEIFTLWKEIFKPIYDIDVPDDRASETLGRMSPAILFVVLVALVVLGEIA